MIQPDELSLIAKRFKFHFLIYVIYIVLALIALTKLAFFSNETLFPDLSTYVLIFIIFMIIAIPNELNLVFYFPKFYIFESQIQQPYFPKESPYLLFLNRLYLYPETLYDFKTLSSIFLLSLGGLIIQALCRLYNIQIVFIFLAYLFVAYFCMPQMFRIHLPLFYSRTRLFEKVKN